MGDCGTVVLCSHGNWAVLPRDGVEAEVVPFLWSLSTSFSSSIKSSLCLNHLDLDERFFSTRQNLVSLSCKDAAGNPCRSCNDALWALGILAIGPYWQCSCGASSSPLYVTLGSAASEKELYTIIRASIGHLSTIYRKPTVLCQSSICLWGLGADCPNALLRIQGLQLEAPSKEGSVQPSLHRLYTDLIHQAEEPEKVELGLSCPFYVQ